MKRRAVIYCRISRDPAQTGLGVRRQEHELREIAERLGYEVVFVYVDNDRSAYARKPRPAYDAMIAALVDVDVLLVYAVDRLTRSPVELEALIDVIEETGVEIVTATNGTLDLATGPGRLSARVVGAVARAESEQKSARLRSKHAELLRDGESAGGGRAFGFEVGNAVVRDGSVEGTIDEAAVLLDAVERFLDGESIRSLVDDLNRRGILSPRGKRWTTTSFRGVLGNPRIAGLRTTTERTKDGRRGARREVGEATWSGIVSVDDFRRVEAILAGRRTERGREPRLLTGLLVCDLCGAKLIASKRAKSAGGFPVYECNRQTGTERGCRRNSIRADLLERILVPKLIAKGTGYVAATKTVDVSAAETELARIAAGKRDLGIRLADGNLDPDVYDAAIGRFEERTAIATETIRRAATTANETRVLDGLGDLDERWDATDDDGRPLMTLAAKRAALASFVVEVRIGGFRPGRGFDAARIGTPKYR